MQLILASNSWIRTLFLDKIGIKYTKDPPEVDERSIKAEITDPYKLVVKLSELKAKATAEKYKGKDFLIVGSDSQNMRNGVAYGKPKTKEQAFEMIKAASNTRDTQLTGYCVINAKTGQLWSGYTELHFDYLEMSDKAINDYINSSEKVWKCSGGFDIGSSFYLKHCAKVEGSHGLFHAFPWEEIVPILKDNGFEF